MRVERTSVSDNNNVALHRHSINGYGTASNQQHTQQATNGQAQQVQQVSPDYYSGTSQQYLPNSAGYYGSYQQASSDYAHDAYV